ncbi:MAG: J domain-containing protein [Candidatus Pacebacteria bacterium]|nr:J domain-containing protein [Candidatus Paceibacterota bacterium]
MRDPYDILGIKKNATPEAIKLAYRKLVKQYHPDLHPGDKVVESKFKEISSAYEILSDSEKRQKFDRGEIDGNGNEQGYRRGNGSPWGRGFGGGGGGSGSAGGGGGAGIDPDDIFDIFARNRRGGPIKQRGNDINYSIVIGFTEAINGGKKRITLPDGNAIDLAIPPGTEDRAILRLRGKGHPGLNGGEAGDALMEIQVESHPFFTRVGNDIAVEIPVTIYEAALGATITVPTVEGKVAVKVPAGSNSGTILRLKERGVPHDRTRRGNQNVKLVIVHPDIIDADYKEFLEAWSRKNPYRLRTKFGVEE